MILRNLQLEQRLCLILARKELSAELAECAECLIRGGLDWDGVWDFSVRHMIFPLIFRHLERFRGGVVPARIMRLFYVLTVANSQRSDMLAKELARIVQTFAEAGIPVVPFKGPLFGSLVWGDHRLWSGQDLDLLVRRRDLEVAKELLCAGGCRVVFGSKEHDKPRGGLLGRGKPAAVMLAREKDRTTVFVDLHESLFPWAVRRKSLDEQVWDDVRPGNIFGASGMVLPPFWSFIVLSLHAAKHLFVRLRWVSDLYALWSKANTDREMIIEKSQRFGLDREVLLSIAVCERLLGTDPEMSFPVDKGLVRRLGRNVFRRSLSPVSAALLQLHLPGSMVGKVYRLATALLQPTIIERNLLPLPKWLHFLHYGIRPVRLVLKHGLEQPIGRVSREGAKGAKRVRQDLQD